MIWHQIDVLIDGMIARTGRAAALDRELAEVLRVIAAAIRSGSSLPQAFQRAATRRSGRAARACGTCAARIELGRAVEDEVDRFALELETPAARLFAMVVRVQHRHGGDLATPCHRLATLLHERCRLDAEARSATAQARFSARAVLAIPLLLVIAAAWRAPDAVQAALQPAPLLLASPGVALILSGALIARRVARNAIDVGRSTGSRADADPLLRRAVRRVAGVGPRSRRAARLVVVAAAVSLPALIAQPSLVSGACALVAVGSAGIWPWMERSSGVRARGPIGGVEELLEVSIALFSAGATAHDVAVLAPRSVPEPLRSHLELAADRVGLGRSIASSFGAVEIVAASPQLDGWLHAVCTSAELGAPASDVLEQLLRDARAERRERLRSIAQTAGPRMQLVLVFLVVPGIMWIMLLASLGGLLSQLRSAGIA